MIQSNHRPTVVFDSIIYGLQHFGGISNYWDRLTSYAAAYGTFDSTLLLPRKILARAFDPASVRGANLVNEITPVQLSRFISGDVDGATIFHTSYYRPPRRAARKYVVTVYDFIYERYRTGLARWVHHRQKLESIRRADEVICISECTRNDVLEFCPEVDPTHVHVVPLAVDQTRYFSETMRHHAEEPCEVLFVGQRSGYKRFDLAVEAIHRGSNLHLGIVGPVLTYEELNLLQGRLFGRWTYHGAVPGDQLRNLYAGALCFVFPSDYEGFGLPMLEAMACGCPVVSSNAASLPEVGGNAALYAFMQDADAYAHAFEVLRQPEIRKRLITLGLARSREYTWNRTCEQTFEIYGIS